MGLAASRDTHQKGHSEVVWITRGSGVWARRAALAGVLIGAALIPGRVASVPAAQCTGPACARQVAAVRWIRALPGAWAVQGGALGTVLQQGQAYAAVGHGLAVIGYGTTVMAYELASGQPLWTNMMAGFPAGAAIVSARTWNGVVTVGVSIPGDQGSGHSSGRAGRRDEVVLSATTGSRIRTFPAAAYGGAVAASAARTVIVGASAVTSYANSSGKVIWRRETGHAEQAWRADGDDLLVTVARNGYLGPAPVTAMRRIDLRTGAQSVLRPAGGSFDGALSGVIGGVMLFTGPLGLSAYSISDGRLLWRRHGAVPEAVDNIREVVYVVRGNSLTGLDPASERVVSRAATPGAVGLYAVTGGVAFGLDQGALGDAWGYDLARKQVIWTTRPLPWPHFFVDLSGIGGSADPASQTIVLASCAKVGVATVRNAPPPCLKPRLVAIGVAQADGQAIAPQAKASDR
jgi:hypothetical protein